MWVTGNCFRMVRIVLKITFLKLRYPKGMTGRVPLCPIMALATVHKHAWLVPCIKKWPAGFRHGGLSHAGQNYWKLIGWERRQFFSITRALLVIKRAWLVDADWLSTPSLSGFPASNGFWKGILETHRFWVWSKHGCVISTWSWKKINIQIRWSRRLKVQLWFFTIQLWFVTVQL